ncbi:MAG: ABC transporter substrate-binding protein [Promethearchaeota archaeon]
MDNSFSKTHSFHTNRSSKYNLAVCLLLCGVLIFGLTLVPASSSTPPRQLELVFDYHGPYVDDLTFSLYHGSDAQWAALIDGIIDVGNEFITPETRSDIETDQIVADAFWGIACSTHDDEYFMEEPPYGTPLFELTGWPLNHLPLRRAIAMAIDKVYLAEMSFGEHGLAVDSVVPQSFGAWHNPDLPVDYRSGDLAGARALLDEAGFIDRNDDGYRDAPDSDDEVNINFFYTPLELMSKEEYYSIIATNTTAIAEYVGETLGNLGFMFNLNPVTSQTLYYLTHLGTRGYHLALVPFHIPEHNTFYLDDLFYSWNIPYTNFFNFDNETVDALLETLNVTYEYDDFKELVWDIQDAIALNQPLIPLISTYLYTAHRTDKFDHWVDTLTAGSANYWSLLRARLKADHAERNPITGVGGTMKFGLSNAPDTLNPLLVSVDDSWLVLDSIYSRLIDENPNTKEAIPNLARNWLIEPEGDGLKVTFDLVNNATWHDGVSFTSSDVNFTFHYINNLPDPWPFIWPKPFLNFTSIDVVNNITITVHTPLKEYNALFELASQPILPQHIWEGILSPLIFENPRPVGTGPFRFKARPEAGLIYLEYYEEYHYGFPGARQSLVYVDIPLMVWLASGSFIIIMVALAAFWYLRRRPHGFEP